MRPTIGQPFIFGYQCYQLFTLSVVLIIYVFPLTFCLKRSNDDHYHHHQPFKHDKSIDGQLMVEIENGFVQGKLETILDHNVTSYLGIPYAEPPLGEGRFRKPKPYRSKFDGVYNATFFRPGCSQRLGDEAFENLGGVSSSEDCLHLNIWVPQSGNNQPDHQYHDRSPLRPVLFYIFASAFKQASPARPTHRGEYLSAFGDIIIVTPNYRLGFLGFACCGQNDDDMPGNLGLYDMILALKWTRENIRNFGGDPEAITLSGSSAGAIASILLIHSTGVPNSWINNIFIMSGVPANEVMLDSIDVALLKTRYITEQVSCSKIVDNHSDNRSVPTDRVQPLTKDEIDCLRTSANLTAILELQNSEKVISLGASIFLGILPVYGNQLIPSSPELAFNQLEKFKHKSFVIGNVESEGHWHIDTWFNNKTEALQFVVPKLRSMLKTDSIETLIRLNETIGIYFNSIDENDDYKVNKALAQLYSDWNYKCPSLGYGQRLALKGSLVHLYLFDYVPRSYLKPDGTNSRPYGATHGDDTRLIFGNPFRDPYNYDSHDRAVSRRLMEIYSDFIKNRRLPWPPVLVNKFGQVKPLRWRIDGNLNDEMDIDVVRLTDHCDRLNKLRNHKLYEKSKGHNKGHNF